MMLIYVNGLYRGDDVPAGAVCLAVNMLPKCEVLTIKS